MNMSEEERLEWILSDLRASTRLLAEDPGEQLRYLPALGTLPLTDELAIQFGDAVLLLNQVLDAGLVSEETAAELRTIDEKLKAISGPSNSRYRTPEALGESVEWREFRQLARAVAGFGDAQAFYFGLDHGGERPLAWITQTRQLQHWVARLEGQIERPELINLTGPLWALARDRHRERRVGGLWQEGLDPPYFASEGPSDEAESVLVLFLRWTLVGVSAKARHRSRCRS